MPDLTEALQKRREQNEEIVYEDYGKLKLVFKDGLRRKNTRTVEQKTLSAISVNGIAPPLEVKVTEPEKEETCENESRLPPLVFNAKVDVEPFVPPHRIQWSCKEPHFHSDANSTKVQKAATQIESREDIPKDVAIRLALLLQYREDDIGDKVKDMYLTAIRRLKRGIQCSKVCEKSLRVKRKLLFLDAQNQSIIMKGVGYIGKFRTTIIDFRFVKSLNLGTNVSPAFKEIDRRIIGSGMQLERRRCCAFETMVRYYSLICDRKADVDALCAVYDIFSGQHGPSVWQNQHMAVGGLNIGKMQASSFLCRHEVGREYVLLPPFHQTTYT